jgi:L-aspartate oxidase
MDLTSRFPGISAFLSGYGLSLARDLIPVSPAAHYLMGGVRTDVHGRTSIAGLYAAGEAACTGVHGANRLASNSLLEGLVFGKRAAETMRDAPALFAAEPSREEVVIKGAREMSVAAAGQWIVELRQLMWDGAGLLRSGSGLRTAQERLSTMGVSAPEGWSRAAVEARNLHTLGKIMVQSALARQESRGSHFRIDFPEHASIAQHSVARDGANGLVPRATAVAAEPSPVQAAL